jgi:acetyl esterase/lipase
MAAARPHISACQSSTERAFTTPATVDPAVTVESDIQYREVDGQQLAVNSCIPATAAAPTPGVLLLHGGGFIEGSRDSGGMTEMCRALAKAGLAAFSIDYRLVPEFHFPAQTDDAAAAIAWLRGPEQVTKFNIDPARLGVLGSSAGAIIAQYLGVAGDGPLDAGTRVKAVASYSGVSDMSQKGLTYGKPSSAAIKTILDYLGCTTTKASGCPDAIPASPIAQVSAGDPAMILLNSDAEIVPVGQTTAMQTALDAAGVTNKVIIASGSKHGMQLNTADNQAAVIEFLTANL